MGYNRGKLAKHNVLAGASDLASSLPATRRMNKQNFWVLLDRYGKVIVKPSYGTGGAGVIQVSSEGDDKYEVHEGNRKINITGLDATFAFVQRKTTRSPHIVQQKIPLATVNGRPFDVRVMIQKNKSSGVWTVTGKLAKIAGSGYIITNFLSSKGSVIPLSSAISNSNIRGISEESIQTAIDRTALKAVKQLQKYYPIHTIGLDIGLDAKGNVWIIEANFSPLKWLFLRLKDKSMYRRIMSYN